MSRLVSILLALAPLVASAAPPEDQWFTVLLDGRKIGSFETTRTLHAGRVVTSQTLDLSLDRAGTAIALASKETTEETPDGRPLAFRSESKLSGAQTIVEGTVAGGSIHVRTRTGGAVQERDMPWPEGALMPEGLRLLGVREGLAPGTRYQALAFQPSSLDAAGIETKVGREESVDLPGGAKTLTAIEQTMLLGGVPVPSRLWVDPDQTVQKLTMPVIGVDLVLLSCDRTCATAPNQGTDIFDRTLMVSPRALGRAELERGMRYTLVPSDGGAPLKLPATGEQSVASEAGALAVEITPTPRASGESGPAPADYAPNDWLQSKAPEVESLARKAAAGATEPLARMRQLESFVRSYIRTKSLGVGYASALEVARTPEGDCTEHAVLLAALGRSLGIATRVVDGLAYAPGFAGRDRVFVPHAWVQAWIGGHWQSFDAALPGFDAGHIALSVGDGDPWRFYSGLDVLGRIALKDAVPLEAEVVH
ncbi:MAG TPA: transglutaminase-like domain-containing protein [Rhodanobacteraceae bacterium]|nr:transglutaminase-like domain-containing protein [Rhodanobacteraceae bacterium]